MTDGGRAGEGGERERGQWKIWGGCKLKVGGFVCWFFGFGWLLLMERHLFMGVSKCNGLVQFHSGTRLSFWVGFGMAEGRETVPRCSAEDIFEERGGGGRREGFSGGILCFCMQIHHVH